MLRSCSPSSSFAAAVGTGWRLGVDLGLDPDGEVGEAGSAAEERVARRGVTGCDIAEGVGGGRRRRGCRRNPRRQEAGTGWEWDLGGDQGMASRERDFGKFWARAVAWAGGKMTHGWAVVDWPLLGQFRSEQKWIHGRSTR